MAPEDSPLRSLRTRVEAGALPVKRGDRGVRVQDGLNSVVRVIEVGPTEKGLGCRRDARTPVCPTSSVRCGPSRSTGLQRRVDLGGRSLRVIGPGSYRPYDPDPETKDRGCDATKSRPQLLGTEVASRPRSARVCPSPNLPGARRILPVTLSPRACVLWTGVGTGRPIGVRSARARTQTGPYPSPTRPLPGSVGDTRTEQWFSRRR